MRAWWIPLVVVLLLAVGLLFPSGRGSHAPPVAEPHGAVRPPSVPRPSTAPDALVLVSKQEAEAVTGVEMLPPRREDGGNGTVTVRFLSKDRARHHAVVVSTIEQGLGDSATAVIDVTRLFDSARADRSRYGAVAVDDIGVKAYIATDGLHMLKGTSYIRLSIEGLDDVSLVQMRLKALARRVLLRLP